MHAKWLCFSLDVRHSGVTSQRQPRQCRGPGAQNGKGGLKWPELCIKTVIRLCTGISQNNHPCLLTLPFRTGRYYSRSECLPGGSKIIVTPLVRQVNDCWFKPRRLYIIFYAGGSLAGAGYCRQCRRRLAILPLQLRQGCQVCVKISAQQLPRVAQFYACWVHTGLLALSGQE